MLLVYTGDGKGKTSACVGQAIRAAGQGLPVAFVQFMKSDVQAGEQKMLAALTGITLHIGGCGFFLNEENRALHRDAALRTLEWATRHLDGLFMMLLDEVLYARSWVCSNAGNWKISWYRASKSKSIWYFQEELCPPGLKIWQIW